MAIRILLAEDEEADVALFTRALARAGTEISLQTVKTGDEALAYLQAFGKYADRSLYPFPDFLILDLKMPQCSGFEVLSWLREHEKCAMIPKIVFTSSHLEEDIAQAYELGANTYFTKPSSFSELVELLQVLFRYWSLAKRPAKPPQERCPP